MKLTRKIFVNSNNGQVSLTLPKKYIDELRDTQTGKIPKKISLEILNPKKAGN